MIEYSKNVLNRDYHVIIVLVVADPENLKTLPDRIYVVDFDSVLGTLSSWKGKEARKYRTTT